jgi:RND family efflux transporter MFP subunit
MSKRRWIVLGAALGVVALGGLAYRQWAAAGQSEAEEVATTTVERGTVTSSIDAGGTLAVPRSASLTWRTSGTVGAVHVQVGDTVSAGDVLMELSRDSLDSSLLQAEADLAAAQQDLQDLVAGPSATDLAAAELRLANARDSLHDAEYNRTVLQQGNRASGDTIAAARASLVLAESDVVQAQDQYDEVSGRPENDTSRANALIRLVQARQRRDSTERTLNWYLGHPSDIEQAQLDAQVATAQAELDAAQEALMELQNGPNAVDLAAARARVAAAQDLVDQARLVAPFDGTVVAVETAEGDLVNSNTAAVTIADLSHYEVQVSVSELDVESLSVGQEVSLSLDALPGQTFVGRVAYVPLVGTSTQGVVTYPVTVEVDDPDPALRPGMTAAVSIIVERHENVLVVANRAIQVASGQRTVTVLYEGQRISVPVTLGLVGDTTSEISDGALKEGDVIVLNASSSSQSNASFGGGGAFGVFRP